MPSAGVHNDEISPLLPEPLDSLLRNDCRVALLVATIERYLSLCAVLLQLVKSSSTEGILAGEKNSASEISGLPMHGLLAILPAGAHGPHGLTAQTSAGFHPFRL